MSSLQSRAKALIAYAKSRLQIATAYQRVYESAEGRDVIHDILREGGVLSVAHVEGDPGTSQFNDGKRALAIFICERLRWSEPELVALARETTTDQLANEEGT